METIYRLNANDLDMRFIESLRQLFLNQEILVSVIPVKKAQRLKATTKYTDKILQAVRNVDAGKTTLLTGDEFEKLTSKLLNQ